MNRRIFVFTLVILILFSLKIFSQNSKQKENPIVLSAAYTTDVLWNINKEFKTGFYYLGNIDLQFKFDTEKAKWWKGGSFFIYGISNNGEQPSESIESFQAVDNIETYDKTQLFECWFKQQFKNFYFLIGQSNMAAMFYNSDYGNTFLNSNFNTEPEITANVPTSIFSKTTLGACLSWDINRKIIVNGCIYNGYTGTSVDNPYGMRYKFSRKYGYLSMLQMNYKFYKNDTVNDWNFKLGVWYHNGYFKNDEAGQPDLSLNIEEIENDTTVFKNKYGFFIMGDKMLTHENNDTSQGLCAYFTSGYVPSKHAFIKEFGSIGVNYIGLFKKRDTDVFGIAICSAFINKKKSLDDVSIGKSETTAEVTYLMQINDHFSFQPDVQYIIHPGASCDLKNSLLAITRLKISF